MTLYMLLIASKGFNGRVGPFNTQEDAITYRDKYWPDAYSTKVEWLHPAFTRNPRV